MPDTQTAISLAAILLSGLGFLLTWRNSRTATSALSLTVKRDEMLLHETQQETDRVAAKTARDAEMALMVANLAAAIASVADLKADNILLKASVVECESRSMRREHDWITERQLLSERLITALTQSHAAPVTGG